MEAQLFCQKYRNYSDITLIPDRLRWCRYKQGLTQEEVAHQVDLSKQAYARLEASWTETPSLITLEKLAKLYELPIDDLLDDYCSFIYYGQAEQAKAYRLRLGLSVSEFSKLHDINESNVYAWETELKTISKRMWERCYSKI